MNKSVLALVFWGVTLIGISGCSLFERDDAERDKAYTVDNASVFL